MQIFEEVLIFKLHATKTQDFQATKKQAIFQLYVA